MSQLEKSLNVIDDVIAPENLFKQFLQKLSLDGKIYNKRFLVYYILHNLRGISSNLCLPKPRTNNMKNSFMYDGAKLWNSIPKDIRKSKSLLSFRNKIAAHTYEL